jgi:imidazolonepropionase-like amidohydrolase
MQSKGVFFIIPFLFLALQHSAQTVEYAVTGAAFINTANGKVIENAVILVEGDKIKEVGVSGKVKIPAGLKVIDAKGKWILPGMIDGHIHFFQSAGLYTRPDAMNLAGFYSYEKDQQWVKDNRADLMRRYLACGITSVVDVGGPFSNFDVRAYCNSNTVAPNAFVTGPLISTYQPPNLDKADPPIVKVKNEEEAIELVRKQLPYKPDFIKIWYIVLPGQDAAKTLPIVKASIEEAHKNNLKVAVHATEYNTAVLAVNAGCDILVHSIDDKPADAAFVTLLKSKNVTYIPTMLVGRKYRESFTQQHSLSQHDFKYANPFALGTLFDLQHLKGKGLPFDYKKVRAAMRVINEEDSVMRISLKLVADAGINVATGTDAGNIGTHHAASYLTELLAMRDAGMSNMQVLAAGTINAARGFGKEGLVGSLEKGKLADFIILDKNPLDDLNNLDFISTVVHRGNIIAADTLLATSPEILVQQQLNAYNNRDIDAFLAPYSDSVEIYEFPAKLLSKGKDKMRTDYAGMFRQTPELHCKLVNRVVQGNTVIDQESVTGFGPNAFKAIAIYKIAKGKIQQVYFIQ